MSDYLHSLPLQLREIFKGIFGVSLNDFKGEVLWSHIFGCRNELNPVSDTTTSFLGGLTLLSATSRNSGEKSTFRLWLILGGVVIIVELPAIWLITLLKALRDGIVTLGRGFGKVLSGVGKVLKDLVVRWGGRLKGS